MVACPQSPTPFHPGRFIEAPPRRAVLEFGLARDTSKRGLVRPIRMVIGGTSNSRSQWQKKKAARKERLLPHFVRLLFTDDVVGPFHQGNVDRNGAPLRVPTAQVRLRDPTGPGTGSSRKYRDVFGYNLRHGFAQGRPSDGFDRIHGRLAHQVRSVVGEKYLHVMPGLRECDPVGKDEGCAGRLIGSPGTPHQNVQFPLRCLRLLSLRLAGGNGDGPGGERASSQLCRLFKKVSASCHTSSPAGGKTLHEPRADYKVLLGSHKHTYTLKPLPFARRSSLPSG